MKTSQSGIDLLKAFEGCELKAYKALSSEKDYTIGYGHCGPDVKPNMEITFSMAEEILKKDLIRFEKAVEQTGLLLNQNQFDALISFTFNNGEDGLKRLVKNRNLYQISNAILLYNKSGGKICDGLVRRRKIERELFLKEDRNPKQKYKVLANALNVRSGAGMNYKIVGTLLKGDIIEVQYITGDWAKFSKGFCFLKYLLKL